MKIGEKKILTKFEFYSIIPKVNENFICNINHRRQARAFI